MIEIKANRCGLSSVIINRGTGVRNSAAVVHNMTRPQHPRTVWETRKMTATKAPKQRQQSQSQEQQSQHGSLDQRYGKIGISAVAGAVGHKGERHEPDAPKRPYIQNDSD
jgi:hypothetical protein